MPKKKAEGETLEEEPKGKVTGVEDDHLEDEEDDDSPVVEFAVEDAEVKANKWPLILAGICEFCGCTYQGEFTDQKGKPLSCKHYSKLKIHCSYCRKAPLNRDCAGRIFHVYSLASDPKKLIVTCDDYGCLVKHQRRAKAGQV